MSMSTDVYGIIPPDKKYARMKAIWDACSEAGIEYPEEVSEFFNWEEPCDKGTIIHLKEGVSEYSGDAEDGMDVNLSKLPDGVKILRFVNSY